jgi:hypothetical protein
MASKIHVLLAGAALLIGPAAMAAEERVEIKSDPDGKHYIVERQGTSENPVLVTKRVGPDKSVHFMKRSIDCKSWKVRNLGEGPTLEAMNKGTPDPEGSPITEGSIPDHFARKVCPSPPPGTRT